MKNLTYLAVFEPSTAGSYSIYFPDLPGCISVGSNLENAKRMAIEAANRNNIPSTLSCSSYPGINTLNPTPNNFTPIGIKIKVQQQIKAIPQITNAIGSSMINHTHA